MSSAWGTCCLMLLYCRISGVEDSEDIWGYPLTQRHRDAEKRDSVISASPRLCVRYSAPPLGVDPPQLDRVDHPVQGHHVGRDAVVHVVGFGVVDHSIEGFDHNLLQPLVDRVLIPEEALAVLHPLEIGDRDAAGIGQNIGNDEDTLL